MPGKIGAGVDFNRLQADLKAIREKSLSSDTPIPEGKEGFGTLLQKGIEDVNQAIRTSEQASMDLASGKTNNIHEAMIATARAELGFQMLVQLRNKALEAYQEVMRMQV